MAIDSAPPELIIPLLNDYAEVVVAAIHGEDGEVPKLIGDGVLAIFRADEPARACAAAMCRSADQRILMSAAFVEAARDARRFVSVGRYALRGVGRARELFTLDPDRAD